MHLTKITFPQIHLHRRDGHKLRGYFADTFGQESDLFHNHDEAGKTIYRYPRIQYKILGTEPTLIGINEGAEMLIARFLEMKMININGCNLPLDQKNLRSKEYSIGLSKSLHTYRFLTPWMALNPKNYKEYINLNEEEQTVKLQKILIGNMIAFFKSIPHQIEGNIMVSLQLQEPTPTKFKNQTMLSFKGSFVTNVQLPDYIGLGKSVARGFGAIEQRK